jgi:hypothetical protein
VKGFTAPEGLLVIPAVPIARTSPKKPGGDVPDREIATYRAKPFRQVFWLRTLPDRLPVDGKSIGSGFVIRQYNGPSQRRVRGGIQPPSHRHASMTVA